MSLKSGTGVDQVDADKLLLRRQQALLYEKHFWPHLRAMSRKDFSVGQRYADIPGGVELTRLESVRFRSATTGNLSEPAERGISFCEYDVFDSDAGVRADGPYRWDLRAVDPDSAVPQIEIWPVPLSGPATLMWRGLRPLRPLIEETDTCDLDGSLIVLFAAAKKLSRSGSKDARDAGSAAQSLYGDLIAGHAAAASQPIIYGGMQPTTHHPRHTIRAPRY